MADNKIKWGIDKAHSEIGFTVKHLMVSKVRGQFKEYDANIVTTGEDFTTAEVDFWMDPLSVDTGSPDRDKHIKSPDFFDAENHKQINFKGNTIVNVDNDGSYELHGDLAINGIAKRVKLDVEFGGIMKDPWGNQKAVVHIHGPIHRKEWGLNWNAALEAGGVLVSDEVKLDIDIQLFKQA
ncbi:MAG: YceI family protein [Saprospiraceae bacterium]